MPIHDDGFRSHVWTRYRKPHALRHTFASLLIEPGESFKYVQEQPGHRSPAFTMAVYWHLIPRGDRRAVDRLDAAIRTFRAIEDPSLVSLVSESAQIHLDVSELSL